MGTGKTSFYEALEITHFAASRLAHHKTPQQMAQEDSEVESLYLLRPAVTNALFPWDLLLSAAAMQTNNGLKSLMQCDKKRKD